MFLKNDAVIYSMSPVLAFFARTVPGVRLSIARLEKIKAADWCEFDGVLFPFDDRFMDRKRFVAIAAGAIEQAEVSIATKTITQEDVVVEFGAGLGIAASRMHKLCVPKRHICFEANPIIQEYITQLIAANNLQMEFQNIALGNGKALDFYAMDDYILSSFEKPKQSQAYRKISVPTISLEDVVKTYQPSAIFCDIEGAELDYFTARDFAGLKKIVIELHPEIYGLTGQSAFCERMQKNGFKLARRKQQTFCFFR
jgi:FkbM family methyltransferase